MLVYCLAKKSNYNTAQISINISVITSITSGKICKTVKPSHKQSKQTNEPYHGKRAVIVYANSIGSGEPAHLRRLA